MTEIYSDAYAQARDAYAKAAELNHPGAMSNLGVMFDQGQGGEKTVDHGHARQRWDGDQRYAECARNEKRRGSGCRWPGDFAPTPRGMGFSELHAQ